MNAKLQLQGAANEEALAAARPQTPHFVITYFSTLTLMPGPFDFPSFPAPSIRIVFPFYDSTPAYSLRFTLHHHK